jgi:hypothetical protein
MFAQDGDFFQHSLSLKNKIGCQKFAFMIPNHAGDDLLVQICLFGGNRRIKGLKRFRFRQQRIFTKEKRLRIRVSRHPNGREHLLARTLPDPISPFMR